MSATVSLILLGLYFHPKLSAVVAINAGLLLGILVFQWQTNGALSI